MMDFHEIILKFETRGSIKQVIPWGNGHINDTFRVINNDDGSPDYILQRINDKIFSQVENLMVNQDLVIEHAKSNGYGEIFRPNVNVKGAGGSNINDYGNYLFRNEQGWWRMTEFASGFKSYDLMPDVIVARKAGFTIGRMIVALSTFNASKLHVTIPDFHNLHHRMNQLNEAWNGSSKERKEEGQDIMNQIKLLAPGFLEMHDTALSGELPLRAAHNDTKLNNLLIHPENDVGVVIDLDTLMPGYSFYDIGDVLRSGIISAEEDESDLTKVTLNYEAYSAFYEALVKASQSVLTPKEIEYIPLSGGYMSFMLAVRFLTDFFNNDIYFKTKYSNHNLVRAKCQLRVSDLFKELRTANL